MKYKNLKINVASYSIFLYITGLITSSVAFPIFCSKKPCIKTEITVACTEMNDEPDIIEIEEIEIEEENVEEVISNDIDLFDIDDDYYDLNTNEYHTDVELKNVDSFVITTNNKTYEDHEISDFELFTAVVASESEGNRYDALALATSIANRCDSKKWVDYVNSCGMDGTDPIVQLTFPGQYEGYLSGKYEKYLNGTLEVPVEVLDACTTVWFKGIRNNNYCSFRAAHAKGYSDIQIIEGGNRFSDELELVKTYY